MILQMRSPRTSRRRRALEDPNRLEELVGEPAVDRAIAFESAMNEAKAKAEHDAAVARGENPGSSG
jgi:hypothetical protein